MENQAGNPAVSQPGGMKPKIQNTPFRPKATMLVDVLPANSGSKATTKGGDEGLLRELVMNTESSAQRIQSSKMKWQLATLILAMLFLACGATAGWLYVRANAAGVQQGRLQMENQSLKDQLNIAGAQVTGLKGELEIQLNRNLELAGENAQLKTLKKSVAAPVVTEVKQTAENPRIEAIRKGTYPSGTTKDELIAALGEPDRVYKARGYEQLVYFGKKPGRFWLIGGQLLHTSE